MTSYLIPHVECDGDRCDNAAQHSFNVTEEAFRGFLARDGWTTAPDTDIDIDGNPIEVVADYCPVCSAKRAGGE